MWRKTWREFELVERVRGEGERRERDTGRPVGRREGGRRWRGRRSTRPWRTLWPAAGPSRMTIISGHWVHGAWRLSFAPYSYACSSCLSKPSLF